MGYFAHETAVIDAGASIGDDCKIWHFSHVSTGACLGKGVSLGQNVFIGRDVLIGGGSKIQNNVSVFTGVRLDEHVFCGPSVVFTNVINPRANIDRKDEFKQTHIQYGSSLGANSTILCGITVGRYSLVGAGSVVVSDVLDFALVVGNPARQIGWVSAAGVRLDLPVAGVGEALCTVTGAKYSLAPHGVVEANSDEN